MERYKILVHILLLFATATAQGNRKSPRTDYQYGKATRSYYKLHIETVNAVTAQRVCKMEGAELMIPTSQGDIEMVHGLLKQFPDIGNFVWVGDDGQKHESAEEPPMIDLTLNEEDRNAAALSGLSCDVVTRRGNVETIFPCTRDLPFVCKVMERDTYYDEKCAVYVEGYTYIPSVGSCYKVPSLALTWSAAYAECQEEGAHLAIINSETERAAIQNYLKTAPKAQSANTDYFFFIGIRADRPTDGSPRQFKTIFNQTLEEAGFASWSEGEPNNHEDKEYCGTVFSNNGLLNDINCSNSFGFLCENEVRKT